MKRTSIEHNIDWLFDPDTPSSRKVSGTISKFPFPHLNSVSTGYTEHLLLPNGTLLINDRHEFIDDDRPKTISLGNFKTEFPSPTFCVHLMHTGKLDIHNNIVSRSIRRVPGVDLFTRLEFLDMNQTLFTEEDIFLSGIFIPEDQLTNLFGLHISDNFFNSLNLNIKNNFSEFRLPRFLSNKIATCIPGHLEGDMRLLFATSAIIQYLFEANIYITNSNKLVIDLGKDDFDVTSLYAELVNVTSEIPKIDELAKKYNVSTVKLNQSFIKKYNQSIYNFLTNQRLEQAYQALLNTDIAMKTLAHKINYSHVNHFITAFKKKFGVTPGSLRRRDKE